MKGGPPVLSHGDGKGKGPAEEQSFCLCLGPKGTAGTVT